MLKISRPLTGFFLAFLVLATCAGSAWSLEPPPRLDYRGLLKTISQHKGRVVVVSFFASWCMPCLKEIPELRSLREEYSEEELVLLGVSVDDDGHKLIQLVDKAGFNYPIYWAEPDVSSVFQISAIPKVMVYNQRGALAVNHVGYMPTTQLRGIIDSMNKQ